MQNLAQKIPAESAGVGDLPSVGRLLQIHDRIRAVGGKAVDCVPAGKIQDKARDFFGVAGDDSNAQLRMIDAIGFAVDLGLFTPSMTGQTAIDRLIRNGKIATPEEKAAAALLRGSIFRLIEITGDLGEGLFEATDLASGENLILFDQKMFCREGARWALRTCFYEGVNISAGPVTPINDPMMEEARPFIVKGRGLKNPLRCAEALYRYFIRYGNPLDGINPDLLSDEDDDFPYDADDGPVHELAAQWAKGNALPEPTPADLRVIRAEAYKEAVFETHHAAYLAHDWKLDRLAAAYDRILVIQLETIHRRCSAGLRTSHETLDGLAAEIKLGVASGNVGHGADTLFDDLCRRAKLACSAKATNKGNREELDKILARIQALRGKTVEQGCTEAEALLAADKVAELLDRYGLSLSEVDMKEQSCSGEGIETNRRRRSPLDECVGTIAEFCDCRTWYEMTANGHIRHIFFGLPADVAGARYLYDKVEEAFDTETKNFKRGKLYESHCSSHRRSATTSFQVGFGHGICAKLDRLKESRTAAARATGGRDLMPIKNAVIEDELSNLGMRLRSIRANRKSVLAKAYNTGRITGENMDWEDKIAAEG
ncbi:MAG: DUF2786 domain-containing protein [Alphaproteobacteria bacterium]|nr:DUF2786 domain-containing protein [Alphaproteobacteria bacterium]